MNIKIFNWELQKPVKDRGCLSSRNDLNSSDVSLGGTLLIFLKGLEY